MAGWSRYGTRPDGTPVSRQRVVKLQWRESVPERSCTLTDAVYRVRGRSGLTGIRIAPGEVAADGRRLRVDPAQRHRVTPGRQLGRQHVNRRLPSLVGEVEIDEQFATRLRPLGIPTNWPGTNGDSRACSAGTTCLAPAAG